MHLPAREILLHIRKAYIKYMPITADGSPKAVESQIIEGFAVGKHPDFEVCTVKAQFVSAEDEKWFSYRVQRALSNNGQLQKRNHFPHYSQCILRQ